MTKVDRLERGRAKSYFLSAALLARTACAKRREFNEQSRQSQEEEKMVAHLIQLIQQANSRLPTNTPIRNGNTILERINLSILRLALLALVDMTLNHDSHNRALPRLELLRDRRNHFRLIPEIFLRVAMARIDHDGRMSLRKGLLERSTARLDTLRIVIRPLVPAPMNNVQILVTGRLDDSCETLVRHAHESVRAATAPDCIYRDCQRAVCAVLESDGHGQARDELAV